MERQNEASVQVTLMISRGSSSRRGLPSGAELLGGWDRAMKHVLSSLFLVGLGTQHKCWGLGVRGGG